MFIVTANFREGNELLLRRTSIDGSRPKSLNAVVSIGCQPGKVAAEGVAPAGKDTLGMVLGRWVRAGKVEAHR